MNVMEAIRKRRSVRSYQERPVEEEKLKTVLEAGRLAPSANNMQEWKFVVVRDEQTRQKLMVAARNQSFVGQAPVVIAACAIDTEKVMSCGQPAYPIDIAIAVDHMTLAAVEEGLGTCWIGAFDENQVKQILDVPKSVRVPIIFTLGYPADKGVLKSRKPLEETFAYDKYED